MPCAFSCLCWVLRWDYRSQHWLVSCSRICQQKKPGIIHKRNTAYKHCLQREFIRNLKQTNKKNPKRQTTNKQQQQSQNRRTKKPTNTQQQQQQKFTTQKPQTKPNIGYPKGRVSAVIIINNAALEYFKAFVSKLMSELTQTSFCALQGNILYYFSMHSNCTVFPVTQ